MRQATVLFKDEEAACLTQHDSGVFSFYYLESWLKDSSKPAIALAFPKTDQTFESDFLFPFFYNMLPEGSNRQVVCQLNRIDPDDALGVLMVTAKYDSIGAVRLLLKND